ncbi:MAG: NrfD/PsrC family molybdoenzyme membrane anchor subunit [Acidimicrobiia bacterium]
MDWTLPNEHIRWGLVVVVYMFLSGVGAGSLVVSVLPRLPWLFGNPTFMRVRRAAAISAAACFTVVPLAVIADLGQPWRMWRVILAPNPTSPMPYGSIALIVLLGLIAANLWLLHRPHFARAARSRTGLIGRTNKWLAAGHDGSDEPPHGRERWIAQSLAIASVVVGLVFVAYTGFLLSTMTSFGLWYTPMLGVVFVLAALASGFAWLLVVAASNRRLYSEPRLVQLLAGSAAVFLGAHVAARLWDLFQASYVENNLWPAVRELLFERLLFSYVVLELVVGGALAVVALAWAARRGSRSFAFAGGLLALIGLFASRWNIIIGGQSVSRTGLGFIEEELHLFGREGIVAAAGLFLWAFIVGLALWYLLPWYEQSDNAPVTDEDSSVRSGGRRIVLGLLGGAAVAVAAGASTLRALANPRYTKQAPGPPPPSADRVVHSICLSCDARCGNRAVVRDGKVRTLFGNPYHPASTRNQPIAFDTPVPTGLESSGSLCLKGVSGIQYLYDPYRIRLPLKRTGPRGSGEFEVIGWDQLLGEIIDGGALFSHIGEDREIEGLRSLRGFDPIDPDQPELGPRAQGLVWNTGRGQTGRQDFIERFMKAYGSRNYVSHTDLCQMNWYVSNYLFTGKYNDDVSGTNQLFGDIVNGEYMLLFGVNLGGGWKPGVNTSAPILANRHANGDGHLVLIDPYVPHGRHYADEWVPIKPSTDAAMVLGMMGWIFEHERFNKNYLENTSAAAAAADGEPSWTNATYLVVSDPDDPRDGRFLRASELGLGDDEFVVIDPVTGDPVPHTRVDTGRLFVDSTVAGPDGSPIMVKSSLQLLREQALARTVDDWAEICDVPSGTIERLADEFTSHGRQATASCYRGAVMHSYGIYAGLAVNMLNGLIGNLNYKGGVVRNSSGPGWSDGRFDLLSIPDAPKADGVHISRIAGKSTISYEESSEYLRKVDAGEEPYPPRRPWYPFTHAGITTEAIAAAESGYPYPVKIWINYYINQRHSVPGGQRFEEVFGDTEKVPLFLSVDTTISETSVFADYIVPDVMYLDGQYGFMDQQAGACTAWHRGIRSPAVEPLTGRTEDGRPMMLETFLIDVAKSLDLPGYGENGIVGGADGPYSGETFPLNTAEDFYLRAVVNMADNASTPPAPAEEIEFVESGYPVASARGILTDGEWRRSAYLLARGGYFDPPEAAWDEAGHHTRGVKLDERAPLQFWHETLATTIESATGRRRPGTATYREPEDGVGRKLAELDAAYPFTITTFRLATRTKARTAYDYWALETHPENRVEINVDDAASLGLRDGDRVRISSPSGSAEGVAKVSHRVRSGSIAATHHYGHTQQGNSPLTIIGAGEAVTGGKFVSPVLHGMDVSNVDGNRVNPDKRRGSRGFNVNQAMRRNDDVLDDMPLVDSAGGATIFLDTRVKVEKL